MLRGMNITDRLIDVEKLIPQNAFTKNDCLFIIGDGATLPGHDKSKVVKSIISIQ